MGKRKLRVQGGLLPARRGGYTARKTIPADCRIGYGKRFGDGAPITEAWFNSGPVAKPAATQGYREWLSEVEARVQSIRAERNGGGTMLSPVSARALAGEWYGWFTAYMAGLQWPKDVLARYRDRMWDGLHTVAEGTGGLDNRNVGNPFDHSERGHIHPVIADEAKTAQFLAAKKITLYSPSRDLFLDYVAQDFFAALDLLLRRASGDFGEDQHAKNEFSGWCPGAASDSFQFSIV
jgi:hypothetical protein